MATNERFSQKPVSIQLTKLFNVNALSVPRRVDTEILRTRCLNSLDKVSESPRIITWVALHVLVMYNFIHKYGETSSSFKR